MRGVCNRCGNPAAKYLCTGCQGRDRNKRMSRSPRDFLRTRMWFSRRSPWPTDLSLDWLMALYETQNGKCAVTGVTMTFSSGGAPTNISVDRKDSTRPYDRDNVHLVCQAINYMKGNLPHEEFAWWCSQVPAPTGPVTPTTPASPTFRHSRGPLGGPHEP